MIKSQIFYTENEKYIIIITIESFTSFYTATPYKKIKYEIRKQNEQNKEYYDDYKKINDSINYIDYTFKEMFVIAKNKIMEILKGETNEKETALKDFYIKLH